MSVVLPPRVAFNIRCKQDGIAIHHCQTRIMLVSTDTINDHDEAQYIKGSLRLIARTRRRNRWFPTSSRIGCAAKAVILSRTDRCSDVDWPCLEPSLGHFAIGSIFSRGWFIPSRSMAEIKQVAKNSWLFKPACRP